MRIKDERVHKKAQGGYIEGRIAGKPRIWLDAADLDVKMLKCRNWRRSAEDRDAWKRKINDAKAQVGLLCHRRKRRKNKKKDKLQLKQYSSVYLTITTLLQFLMFLGEVSYLNNQQHL
jgi:predicted Fe-S protein YdhL (DUF1289 family)